MNMKNVVPILVCAALLAGCGSDEPETKLLEPQRKAIEKAEAVEGLLQGAQQQQKKQMEAEGI